MYGPSLPSVSIGVISDTHGLLRPEAIQAFKGSEYIIHAGDVGEPSILEELGRLAPTTAIRGNIDREPWASALPESTQITLAGHNICILHDLKRLHLDPKTASISVVVSGHTHKPSKQMKDGVLYLNPGSVGPRRFSLPISMAKLKLHSQRVEAELIELDV